MKNSNQLIVVNADDFGMSIEINKVILTSIQKGWISTTTLMCNLEGYEDATELIAKNNLSKNVGIHLNLTEGKPLTTWLNHNPDFVNKDGLMFKSFKGNILNREAKENIAKELQAQVDRFKKMGFVPTHLDSHHHIHHSLDMGRVFIWIAKKNNIPAVRLRFNWGKLSPQRKIFSKYYNLRLQFAHLAKTKIFCEVQDVDLELLRKQIPMEIMVHPYPSADNNITNYKNGKNFESIMSAFLLNKRFVTYDDLSKYSDK